MRERLEAFIIADDVTVEDRTADRRALSVWGADALARLASLPRQAVVFAGKRGVAPNREIVFPAAVENEIQAAFSGVPTRTEAEMERERIDAAIPAVPRDVGPADLPNEAGLEVSAISYTKGCYLGQEVMARLKSMGQVRRRLLRVRGVGAPPATPAALFAGARQVGELRSAIGDGADGFIGLAMISLLPLGAERELALAAGAAPAIALRDTP